MRNFINDFKSYVWIWYIVFSYLSGAIVIPVYSQTRNSSFSNFEEFDISGIVSDAVDIDMFLQKLKSAAMISPDEFNREFGQYVDRFQIIPANSPQVQYPAKSVRVILKNNKVTRETYTDEKGRFFFSKVPIGVYDIFIDIPDELIKKNIFYKNIGSQPMRVKCIEPYTRKSRLVYNTVIQLKSNLLTIKGKIIDNHGNAVVGATVNVLQDIDNVHTTMSKGHFEKTGNEPIIWETISDDDGCYEIRGIPAAGDEVFGYCKTERTRISADSIDIHVTKSGFTQKDPLIRIPLVSELQLKHGRLFLEILNIINKKTNEPEIKEDLNVRYPESEGNIIKNVNIVMEKNEN